MHLATIASLRDSCLRRPAPPPPPPLLQRPLHHLGKDMLDALQPLGTVSEQHASEMEALEPRRESIWGASSSPAPEMLLRLVLAGAPMLTCLRRLLLTIAMRGALPEPAFLECGRVLLDAFGAHHVLTLTALEAAGVPPPLPCAASPVLRSCGAAWTVAPWAALDAPHDLPHM